MYLPNPLIPQFSLINNLGLYNTQIGYILLKTTGTGIAFLMFVGYIKSISRELDEAAAMDGSGYTRYLFTILVPLMKPILATGIILTAIGVWNDIIGPTIYLSDPNYQLNQRTLYILWTVHEQLAAARLWYSDCYLATGCPVRCFATFHCWRCYGRGC